MFRRHLYRFCQAKTVSQNFIESEPITTSKFDQFCLVSTKSYNMLMKSLPNQQFVMVHKPNTPASLLLKSNHLHLFDQGMPLANMEQSFKAMQKLLRSRYDKAYQKCKTGSDIFHLERRINIDMRLLENNIGLLDGRYKHYPLWTRYKDFVGNKTAVNYQKKGVYIDLLKETLYVKGNLWMPTTQNYLGLFDNYLKSNAHQLHLIKNIADVGVGCGVISFLLASRAKKYDRIVGLDINPAAVETANLNAVKLKVDRFNAHVCDIKKPKDYDFLSRSQKLPKQYDLIVSNPPWMVAKKIGVSDLGMYDGVYDPNQQFLKGLLGFASKDKLTKTSISGLTENSCQSIIGLTVDTVESLSGSYKLRVTSRQQIPYLREMSKNDHLLMFKEKSKIILYELTRL